MTAEFPSVMSILWVVSIDGAGADDLQQTIVSLNLSAYFKFQNFWLEILTHHSFVSASTSHTRSAAQRVPLHSWTGSFLPIPRFYHERTFRNPFFVLQVNISRARRCVWTGSCRTSRLIEPGVVDMIKKKVAESTRTRWWWWENV